MARLPRLYAEGCAQHIIQRGNNRDVCFYDEADYAFYLQKLAEYAKRYNVEIHAYVLMTNHVHLLATPAAKSSISSMMQSLGRSYVRYINITYGRSGTLWEGRYKSALVDNDIYLLRVYKYIELNPVRAGMVDQPGLYPWCSFRANAMGIGVEMVTPHSIYLSMGETQASRLMCYRDYVEEGLNPIELDEIRIATNKSWMIGPRFQAHWPFILIIKKLEFLMRNILLVLLLSVISIQSFAVGSRQTVTQIYYCNEDFAMRMGDGSWLLVDKSQVGEKKFDHFLSLAMLLLASGKKTANMFPGEPISWCGTSNVRPITILSISQ